MKKSKKSKSNGSRARERFTELGRWGKMNYRDLQREAIKRGMPFPDVVESDMYGLISYIEKSIINKVHPNNKLIEEYDDWVDDILRTRNIERFPSLRLSYTSTEEDILNDRMVKAKKTMPEKKNKEPKEKRPPRQKNEMGLITGTKKSLTYELVKKGKSSERIIKKVIKKFPDAKEKSILIWIRKAERDIANGKRK